MCKCKYSENGKCGLCRYLNNEAKTCGEENYETCRILNGIKKDATSETGEFKRLFGSDVDTAIEAYLGGKDFSKI